PNPDGAVVVSGGGKQALAVDARRQAGDPIGMAAQSARLFASLQVPHLNGLVLAPRKKQPTVATQGQAANRLGVPGQGVLGRREVPDRNLAASPCCKGVRDCRVQPFAVAAEDQAGSTAVPRRAHFSFLL